MKYAIHLSCKACLQCMPIAVPIFEVARGYKIPDNEPQLALWEAAHRQPRFDPICLLPDA